MLTVSKSEYIGDVVSSGTTGEFSLMFTTATPESNNGAIRINPGQSGTFPYLSTIAQNFTSYQFSALQFTFVSTSASALNSTNTNLGIVFARYESDARTDVPDGLGMILNSGSKVQSKPTHSWALKCPVDKRRRFIRYIEGNDSTNNFNLANNDDIREYDAGYFICGSHGIQGTNTILGQIHVSYTVTLFRPTYVGGLRGNPLRYFRLDRTSYTNAAPLGTTSTALSTGQQNTINMTIGGTGTRLAFPWHIGLRGNNSKSTYLVSFLWTASTGVTVTFPTISGVRCTWTELYNCKPTANTTATCQLTGIASDFQWTGEEITGGAAYVNVAGDGTLPNGGTPTCTIIVSQVTPLRE